jgi:hypothetical protein
MKTKFLAFAGMMILTLVAAGCYSKVSGGHRAGMPFVRDQVAGAYERPLEEVYTAAKDVVTRNGVLTNEGIDHGQTNLVKTIQGRINQRMVNVKVEQVEPKMTHVTVQARTTGGSGDLDLAHELEKEIALKLVR